MQTYTFVCLNARRASTIVDIVQLEADKCRSHAEALLTRHASADRIEVWDEAELVEVIDRAEPASAYEGERLTLRSPTAN